MKKIIYITSICTTLISCQKTETKPKQEEEPVKEQIKALNVLYDNSGFKTVFDTAHSLGGVNNQNAIGINDFTQETNNRLNLSYYLEIGTQQSPSRTQFRFTKDLITNQFISLPSNVGQYSINPNTFFDKVNYQFFPYSNIYVVNTLKNSTGFGSNNTAEFINDINASASSPNPVGDLDLGYRFPVMNSQGGFGYFSKLTNSNLQPTIGSSYTMFNGGVGSSKNRATLHEVYNNGTALEYYSIAINSDSIKVYKLNYTSFGGGSSYPVYTSSLIKSIPTPSLNFITTARHYSTDGKTLSFICSELNTNIISTFVYNFETNTLIQKLQQLNLDYANSSSDIDIDENGDIYYTGYANNGSNTNGVSVYKKTGSAPPTLVGNDNILISGTVVKLRVLMGKVYCAVTAKQSGKQVYQISIIKQN